MSDKKIKADIKNFDEESDNKTTPSKKTKKKNRRERLALKPTYNDFTPDVNALEKVLDSATKIDVKVEKNESSNNATQYQGLRCQNSTVVSEAKLVENESLKTEICGDNIFEKEKNTQNSSDSISVEKFNSAHIVNLDNGNESIIENHVVKDSKAVIDDCGTLNTDCTVSKQANTNVEEQFDNVLSVTNELNTLANVIDDDLEKINLENQQVFSIEYLAMFNNIASKIIKDGLDDLHSKPMVENSSHINTIQDSKEQTKNIEINHKPNNADKNTVQLFNLENYKHTQDISCPLIKSPECMKTNDNYNRVDDIYDKDDIAYKKLPEIFEKNKLRQAYTENDLPFHHDRSILFENKTYNKSEKIEDNNVFTSSSKQNDENLILVTKKRLLKLNESMQSHNFETPKECITKESSNFIRNKPTKFVVPECEITELIEKQRQEKSYKPDISEELENKLKLRRINSSDFGFIHNHKLNDKTNEKNHINFCENNPNKNDFADNSPLNKNSESLNCLADYNKQIYFHNDQDSDLEPKISLNSNKVQTHHNVKTNTLIDYTKLGNALTKNFYRNESYNINMVDLSNVEKINVQLIHFNETPSPKPHPKIVDIMSDDEIEFERKKYEVKKRMDERKALYKRHQKSVMINNYPSVVDVRYIEPIKTEKKVSKLKRFFYGLIGKKV
ncbi:hypothetical protein COBT_000220 [Conglomerata obtusa]